MKSTIRYCAMAVAMGVLLIPMTALAGFIDFENGVDGQVIASTIPGLSFTNTAGYDWIYGDWRAGYNGPYPNGMYYSNGNFFAWLGTTQGSGVITFTASYATYFQVGYSSYSNFYLEAYDELGNLLDSDFGSSNLNTGVLDYLRVDAPGMAYVMVHDTGNYWLIDDLSTDAISECTLDIHCDDGVYCNGEETCVQYQCQDGTPVICADDGNWCNGDEFCDATLDSCQSTGNPCPIDDGLFCNGTETADCDETLDECMHTGNPCEGIFESCNEDLDECEHIGGDDDDDTADDDDDDTTADDDDDDTFVDDDDDDSSLGDDDDDDTSEGDDDDDTSTFGGGGEEEDDESNGCCG